MHKLKVGLVGVMSPAFMGDKEAGYGRSRADLEALAPELGFALQAESRGLYSPEEAAQAAARLADWGADLVIIQASSFSGGELIYPFARTGIRLGLWAVAEGERKEGELPFNSLCLINLYNSLLGTVIEGYPHPVPWYYGPVAGDLFRPRFSNTVRALRAVVRLAGARVGLLGGVVPGFDNLIVDEDALQDRLGVTAVHHPFEAIQQRAERFQLAECKPLAEAMVREAMQVDPGLEASLLTAARVEMAIRQIAAEHGYDAVAVACWPQFQSQMRYGVCSVMGRLNGSRLVAACEGDLYSAVSMLALQAISGDGVATVMDLVDLDEPGGAALLWHCGPGPAPLADQDGLHLNRHYLLSRGTGQEMGVMGNLVFRPGAATIMSFTGDFSRLLLLSGRFDNSRPSFGGARGWLTDLRWGGEPVSVRDVVSSVMASRVQHHYPLVYGDHEGAVLEMASWLGARPLPVTPYRPYLQPGGGRSRC